MRLSKEDFVLAVMSTAGANSFSPVQLQKLFFLLDERAATELGGKYFGFIPYDYGPFDPSVYGCVESLASRGLAVIDGFGSYRRYCLTLTGQVHGRLLLSQLSSPAQLFVGRCSEFVRSLSFSQLVSAIYKEFPAMKANSVFRTP